MFSRNRESRVSVCCKVEIPGLGRKGRCSGIVPGRSHWWGADTAGAQNISFRLALLQGMQGIMKVPGIQYFGRGSHLVRIWTNILWMVIQWKLSSVGTTVMVVFSLCCVLRAFKASRRHQSMAISILVRGIQESTFLKDPHEIPLCSWSWENCSWEMFTQSVTQMHLWNCKMLISSLCYNSFCFSSKF